MPEYLVPEVNPEHSPHSGLSVKTQKQELTLSEVSHEDVHQTESQNWYKKTYAFITQKVFLCLFLLLAL